MSALEQDLAGFLAGDDPDFTAEPEAPQDADVANRRLRQLAKVRSEIMQVQQEAAAEMARIEGWLHARLDVLEGRQQWLAEGLEMWHRAVLSGDPSRKTISLPCGTLKARAQQPVWEFDEPTFLAWAVEHAPDLVRVPEPKPQVEKAAAKKALIVTTIEPGATVPALTAEGEVVPGVTVTARPPSFTVSTEVGAS